MLCWSWPCWLLSGSVPETEERQTAEMGKPGGIRRFNPQIFNPGKGGFPLVGLARQRLLLGLPGLAGSEFP